MSCDERSYFAARVNTYAFTASKAEALFEKRCDAKYSSSSRKYVSRSASFAHSKATPCSLFGALVNVALNSEQLNPFNPGKIFQLS